MGSETVASDNRIKENILSATVELDWLYSPIVTYHSEHCILLLDYLDFENVLQRHFHLILDPLFMKSAEPMVCQWKPIRNFLYSALFIMCPGEDEPCIFMQAIAETVV